MRPTLTLAAVAGMLLAGCAPPHDKYIIHMTPNDSAVQRDLSVWHVDPRPQAAETQPAGTEPTTQAVAVRNKLQPPPQEIIEHLNKLYPTSAPAESGGVVFRGAFKHRLPSDLGESGGWYSDFHTSLGSMRAYLENVRGDDDLASPLEARFRAADRLADTLAAFAKWRLGNEEHFIQLQSFLLLDKEFRRNLKNMSLLLWTASLQHRYVEDGQEGGDDNNKFMAETAARAAQYLLDHGYVTVEDVPIVAKALKAIITWQGDCSQTITAAGNAVWKNAVVNKLAIPPGGLRDRLLELALNPARAEEVQKAFVQFIAQSPEYKLAAAEAAKKDPEAQPPDPGQWFRESVSPLFQEDFFLSDLFAKRDEVTIIVDADTPVATNGHWDPKTKQITWSLKAGRKLFPTSSTPCGIAWMRNSSVRTLGNSPSPIPSGTTASGTRTSPCYRPGNGTSSSRGFAHPRTWRPTWSDSASPRPRFRPRRWRPSPRMNQSRGRRLSWRGWCRPRRRAVRRNDRETPILLQNQGDSPAWTSSSPTEYQNDAKPKGFASSPRRGGKDLAGGTASPRAKPPECGDKRHRLAPLARCRQASTPSAGDSDARGQSVVETAPHDAIFEADIGEPGRAAVASRPSSRSVRHRRIPASGKQRIPPEA